MGRQCRTAAEWKLSKQEPTHMHIIMRAFIAPLDTHIGPLQLRITFTEAAYHQVQQLKEATYDTAASIERDTSRITAKELHHSEVTPSPLCSHNRAYRTIVFRIDGLSATAAMEALLTAKAYTSTDLMVWPDKCHTTCNSCCTLFTPLKPEDTLAILHDCDMHEEEGLFSILEIMDEYSSVGKGT